MNRSQSLRDPQGFTLVEVMVALAVVAVALPALLFSLHQQIDGTAYLRDKSIAHIVAANKLTEIRLLSRARGQLLKGKDEGSAEMAGRQWNWQLNSTESELPKFYRVEVKVFPSEVADASALYTLVGFISTDMQVADNSSGR
jgi:general secretion pathway protein I